MGLVVSDLSCRRAGRLVLDHLDFEVAPGEMLLLRGPNGVGKSTLLRALAGLLPLSGGKALLDGCDLAVDPDEYGERIAYAGHLDAIKPQLTVAENLAFWAALFGGDLHGTLARFDLSAISDRPAHFCSAGQRRRLGLARMLLAPRQLWLLDEPTVSLDAGATAALCRALCAHAAGGGLAVIATHVELDLPSSRSLTLTPAQANAADPFLEGAFG